jgi:hypothetical protein
MERMPCEQEGDDAGNLLAGCVIDGAGAMLAFKAYGNFCTACRVVNLTWTLAQFNEWICLEFAVHLDTGHLLFRMVTDALLFYRRGDCACRRKRDPETSSIRFATRQNAVRNPCSILPTRGMELVVFEHISATRLGSAFARRLCCANHFFLSLFLVRA